MYLAPSDLLSPDPSTRRAAFKVRETLLEKGSGLANEDALAIGDNLYAVCDGATSLNGRPAPGQESGGGRAAAITADAFLGNDGPLIDLAARANTRIHEAMREAGVDFCTRENLWSTSFAAIRCAGESIDWCQTGDCMILLLYRDGTSRVITDQPFHDVETLTIWKEMGAEAQGTIHEELSEQIAAARREMNRTYGVLNGESAALDFVATGREDIRGVTDILLFSDGLFLPNEHPDRPLDGEQMARWYRSTGLHGIRDRVRSLQQDDPRCCRYPRFKMHDDISAIALARS